MIEPELAQPLKSLENIAKALQAQFERWQPKARYRQALDPTPDDLKKVCQALRKLAKDDRVMVYYNGHGVPRPTVKSEIWLFNKDYTQYLPLNIANLCIWSGCPAVFVFDCSAAGVIVNCFKLLFDQQEAEIASGVLTRDTMLLRAKYRIPSHLYSSFLFLLLTHNVLQF